MTEQASALDTQVGGGHYKSLKLQPVQIAMHNGFDACTFAIMKYAMRFGDKNGPEDIRKAIHFVALREETMLNDPYVVYPSCVYTAEEVCAENGYEGHQAAALKYLWDWFYGTTPVAQQLGHKLHREREENKNRLLGALHCLLAVLVGRASDEHAENGFDEARADAIGQNGNDGEHYDHIHQRFGAQE